jgi:hypothetical protein
MSAVTAQQFRETRSQVLPNHGTSVAVGDVDADGHIDFVFGISGSAQLVRSDGRSLRNETAARLPPPPIGPPILLVADVDLADLDGDGDLDLLIASQNALSSVIYRNDGEGFFNDDTAVLLPPATYGVLRHLVADVDRDGDLDVLVDTASGPDRLLRNNGSGTFTDVTQTHLPPSSGSHLMVAGDFDGDLDADVLLGPVPTLWLNDGTGRFTGGPTLPLPWVHNVSLADLNGDGRLDVVARGYFANTTTMLLSQSNGALAPAPANGVPPTLRPFDLADIDGDGDVDVVGHDLLLNDGNGTFTNATAGAFPPLLWHHTIVRVVDIDRDEDQDVLFFGALCFPGCEPQVLLNHRIQLVAPWPPWIGTSYDVQVFAARDALQDPVLALVFGSLSPGDEVLPGIGWIGIPVAAAVPLPSLLLLPPDTTATLTLPVPMSPSLVGTPLYFQSLVLMSDNRLRRSNAFGDRIQ